jgi:hypothetical protein
MKEIIIQLTKKDIKGIAKAHKYLCDIKSDLLEEELGKILFQSQMQNAHLKSMVLNILKD